MTKTKLLIELSDELIGELYDDQVDLESLYKKEGFEIGREEVKMKGEPVSRGVFLYIILRAAEKMLKETLSTLGEKVLEEVGDQVRETAVGRILSPLLKWLEGKKKEDEKIVINIKVLVQTTDKAGNEELEIQPLSDKNIELVERVLLSLKKEKK